MALEPGDIVFCEFEHTDGKGVDDRTVLVLALAFADGFIGCMITSQATTFEHRIQISNQDLQYGALGHNPSFVRFRRLATIDQETIRRKVGQAKPEFVNSVMEALRNVFSDI